MPETLLSKELDESSDGGAAGVSAFTGGLPVGRFFKSSISGNGGKLEGAAAASAAASSAAASAAASAAFEDAAGSGGSGSGSGDFSKKGPDGRFLRFFRFKDGEIISKVFLLSCPKPLAAIATTGCNHFVNTQRKRRAEALWISRNRFSSTASAEVSLRPPVLKQKTGAPGNTTSKQEIMPF